MKRFPVNYGSATELVPMFREVLELCRVKEGEILLLHTDTVFNPHYPAACLAAGLDLGAKVYQIMVPSQYLHIEEEPTILRAWQEADMVIDLVSVGAHLFSMLNVEALKAGTRVLRVAESLDVLKRMFPSPEVRARTEAGAEVLTKGKEVWITSPAGTDLRMSIAGRHGVAQHGIADEAGRWDHWPSGLSLIAPVEGTANGTFVADVGDIIFILGRYINQPLRCEVAQGRVVNIEGGVDALLLKEWLAAQKDERVYEVGVFAWGTDHRARWDRVAWHFYEPAGVMDSEVVLWQRAHGVGEQRFGHAARGKSG